MVKADVKSTARRIVAGAYHASRHYLNRLRGKIVILNYHRVLPEAVLVRTPVIQPGMYVSADAFAQQIRFLRESFEILPFAELLTRWHQNDWDSAKRYCVITFDDGWLDNFVYAFPMLRQSQIPATIFLPTAVVGTRQWFWSDRLAYLLAYCLSGAAGEAGLRFLRDMRDECPWLRPLPRTITRDIDATIEACKTQAAEEMETLLAKGSQALGIEYPNERVFLDWTEVAEMSKHNITFGSHSCTHRLLTSLSVGKIQKELTDSLCTLKSNSINFVPVLAYPNGNYSPQIVDEVKRAGYRAAVTTRFGFEQSSPNDVFELKRVGIHHDVTATLPLFTFHIAGGNQFLAKLQ